MDGKASMTSLLFAAILCSLRFDLETLKCVYIIFIVLSFNFSYFFFFVSRIG